MVVVVIVGILAAVAIPSFRELIATQRVRSVTSDIAGDLVSARVEAIKQQRRVVVERVTSGTSWKDGWRIFVDVNKNNAFDVGETVVKIFNGYGTGGSIKLCAISTEFDDRIVFGGDGTVANSPIGSESGLRISETGARSKDVRISPAGRTSSEDSGASCA